MIRTKKLFPKARVFGYLKKKKVAVTKNTICKYLNLSKSVVDSACSILRKQGKINYCSTYTKTFPARILKTYWGVV